MKFHKPDFQDNYSICLNLKRHKATLKLYSKFDIIGSLHKKYTMSSENFGIWVRNGRHEAWSMIRCALTITLKTILSVITYKKGISRVIIEYCVNASFSSLFDDEKETDFSIFVEIEKAGIDVILITKKSIYLSVNFIVGN